MQLKNNSLFLTVALMLGMALVAFVPATLQAQQQVRITGGPTLDTVNSNSVFITWSTSLPSSSRVWWSKEPYSSGGGARIWPDQSSGRDSKSGAKHNLLLHG